jgi:hypothetical protein
MSQPQAYTKNVGEKNTANKISPTKKTPTRQKKRPSFSNRGISSLYLKNSQCQHQMSSYFTLPSLICTLLRRRLRGLRPRVHVARMQVNLLRPSL